MAKVYHSNRQNMTSAGTARIREYGIRNSTDFIVRVHPTAGRRHTNTMGRFANAPPIGILSLSRSPFRKPNEFDDSDTHNRFYLTFTVNVTDWTQFHMFDNCSEVLLTKSWQSRHV